MTKTVLKKTFADIADHLLVLESRLSNEFTRLNVNQNKPSVSHIDKIRNGKTFQGPGL